MGRAVKILYGKESREEACHWVRKAPPGTVVEFRVTKRSTPQNARMWAMLTAVATQLPWHGVKLSPDDWKLIFMASLRHEMRIVPNIDGTGFVNLGTSTSRLTKAEHSDLTALIEAFAARHEVDLGERAEA
jgi:hypothetical protein